MTPEYFRRSLENGSISTLVAWQTVSTGDVVSVPAGTIHAIGADLIVAEIQQRSDTTYRIFDYGRGRALHIEDAIAVANTGPVVVQARPVPLTEERTLLVSNAHFVFERVRLDPGTTWWLDASRETWLLILSGGARTGTFEVVAGDAIFAQSDRVKVEVGAEAVVGLLAYSGAGGPVPNILQRIAQPGASDAKPTETTRSPPSLAAATSGPSYHREESTR
jgi:mannose-6-phosphate isomerase